MKVLTKSRKVIKIPTFEEWRDTHDGQFWCRYCGAPDSILANWRRTEGGEDRVSGDGSLMGENPSWSEAPILNHFRCEACGHEEEHMNDALALDDYEAYVRYLEVQLGIPEMMIEKILRGEPLYSEDDEEEYYSEGSDESDDADRG